MRLHAFPKGRTLTEDERWMLRCWWSEYRQDAIRYNSTTNRLYFKVDNEPNEEWQLLRREDLRGISAPYRQDPHAVEAFNDTLFEVVT